MRIKRNTRVEIGRLFSCLAYGERVAHDCALRQVDLADDLRTGRFLIRQARQEVHHAQVFDRVLLCLTPRRPVPVPVALERFRARLWAALERGDLVDTLVGQQIVLEGFGELVLDRMNRRLDHRRVGLRRMRWTLVHQEQGHRAFGDRTVHQLLEEGATRIEQVTALADEYLFLIDRVLDELQPLFDVVGTESARYGAELRAGMPGWIDVPAP